MRRPYQIGGYVLAGGRSSRMGRNKALMELAGKPLVQHAVLKLRRLCMDVAIAGGSPEMDVYAPVIEDIHPGCGPLSGIEAALAHSRFDWNLFLPVDMPLMPAAWLQRALVATALRRPGAVAVLQTVDGREQPLCAMYHRDLLPFVAAALETGEFKVMPVVRRAAAALAAHRKLEESSLLLMDAYNSELMHMDCSSAHEGIATLAFTAQQEAAKHLWFANVNSPEDWDAVTAHSDSLDD